MGHLLARHRLSRSPIGGNLEQVKLHLHTDRDGTALIDHRLHNIFPPFTNAGGKTVFVLPGRLPSYVAAPHNEPVTEYEVQCKVQTPSGNWFPWKTGSL